MIVVPGTVIQSPEDVTVGIGATEALPAVPKNTRRMCVQVTGGDATTLIRVRELGSPPGIGIILVRYGSRVYGGTDGALADLEVENVFGPASAVAVQFELD